MTQQPAPPTTPTASTPLRWTCTRLEALAPRELQRIHAARQAVFVVEQACAFQDADAADERAWHLAAWAPGVAAVDAAAHGVLVSSAGGAGDASGPAGGELRAYARLVDPGVKYAEPSIGRVLTTAAARGTGLGRELLRRALAQAGARFPGQGLRISAQLRLAPFYAEVGFVSVGEPYLEDDMPHLEMWRA